MHSRPAAPALAAAIVLALAAGAARAGDGNLLVAGNQKALWLVRAAAGPRTFDVAVRPLSRPWRLVGQGYPGMVEAAAAVNGQLHLIVSNPSAHLVFQVDGSEPTPARELRDPRRPDAPVPVLAAFEMPDANGGPTAALVVVAAWPPEDAPATASASEPASARAGDPADTTTASAPTRPARPFTVRRLQAAPPPPPPQPLALRVFRYRSGEWEHLAEYPSRLAGRPGHVLGAAAGGSVYLYLAAGPDHGESLVSWNGEAWEPLGAPPPPHAQAATASADTASSAPVDAASSRVKRQDADSTTAAGGAGRVLAMTAIGGQPVLLRAAPGPAPIRWRVQLATFDRSAGGFTVQDVRPVEGNAPWAAADFVLRSLLAARLGDQVALLWERQGRLQLGTADLNGQFVAQENVEVFEALPPSGRGQEVLHYFVLGALVLSAALALAMRGRVPMRPVKLPPGVVPALVLRRLLAGLIDLLPMLILAASLTPLPPMTPQEAVRAFREGTFPDAAYYLMLGALGLHVAYCIVLEHRFGTTPGKALLKLRVTDDVGQKATLPQLAQRNILKIVELLLPLGVPVLLLVPLVTRTRQRLGDLFARTMVVTGLPQGETPPEDPPRGD